MATPTSTSEFIELVRKSGAVRDNRLDSCLRRLGEIPDDPVQLAVALVKAGALTKFQVDQLLAGRTRGFLLGQYRVLDRIGQGGCGVVFLAEHDTLRRKVALKVLPRSEAGNALAQERFLREARAAAALDHPNIVRLHDVLKNNGQPVLVMEYVEGITLQALLDKHGPLPYPQVVDYICQAARGLQHAFETGFVHRDIKPGNLILDKFGVVKILDMGLARSARNPEDNLTQNLDPSAVLGTADYVAPEQARNEPDVDIRADIYSLGATFFALVAGTPPFPGNTAQKLLQHQVKDAPRLNQLNKTVPAKLSAVVSKMLAKEPKERYQTPAEVIAALQPWLPQEDGSPVESVSKGLLLAAKETLREVALGSPTKPMSAPAEHDADAETASAPRRRTWPLLAAAAGVAVLITALASWMLDEPVGPTPNNAGPPPAVEGQVISRTELARLSPFIIRLRPDLKPVVVMGAIPANWDMRVWAANASFQADALAECAVEDVGGVRALGCRNVRGRQTVIAAAPGVLLSQGRRYVVTLDYRFAGRDGALVRVKDMRNQPKDLGPLPSTGGGWSKIKFWITERMSGHMVLEFHNAAPGPENTLHVREIEIVDGGPQ